MKLSIIKIGNSLGIRLPKTVIKQCNFDVTVEAEIKAGKLIISSQKSPRQGWEEAFKAMAKNKDDKLIDAEVFGLASDEKEWKW